MAAKKKATKKTTPVERSRDAGLATKRAKRSLPEFQPPPNDHLSAAFIKNKMIPPSLRGTDEFLDIVTWNIRFFHNRDRKRVDRIVDILAGLNADIIVLQEIENLAMDVVADELRRVEAGFYKTAYGTTGGDQRVCMLYDLDFIRAKDDITELFGKGTILSDDGKDAFPRLPLRGYFVGLTSEDPFDFQLLGLHLKSQRGGGDSQRVRSAQALREWLETTGTREDSDVIMIGDWNAPPSADPWEPLRELEATRAVKFQSINNESEISHLMYKSKNNLGSRLDLNLISMSASEKMKEPPKVVRWEPLEKFIEGNPRAAAIKEFLAAVREDVSDHLPVVTRFFFTDNS